VCAFGTDAQRRRVVPRLTSGEAIAGAFALSEAQAGSDPASMTTTATPTASGWRLDGSKQWITSGDRAGVMIVWAKTDKTAGARGISAFLLEREIDGQGDERAPRPRAGFAAGKHEDKMGLRGSTTVPLVFDGCELPADALLGKEGEGFRMLMEQLQQERLCIGVTAIQSCRRSFEDTVRYVKERRAFGQSIASFQNTQFKLVELATQVEVGQAFVDKLLAAHVRGDDVVTEVSMAKWWTTDLQKRLTSECLQLHGGYGFMTEYPISQDYADAAVQTIYAGTNEIMKVIVAKRLGLS